MISLWLLISTIITALSAITATAPTKPTIPIGYATTRITGPLTKNGLVDYVAAFNQRFGKGVTPQNNAAVPLLILFRPGSFRGGENKTVAGKTIYVPYKTWGAELRKAMGISRRDLTGPHFVDFQIFRVHADPMAVAQAAGDTGHLPAAPAYVPGKLYMHPWSAHNHPWAAAFLNANEGALDVGQAAFFRSHLFVPLRRNSPSQVITDVIWSTIRIAAYAQDISENLTLRAMLELHRGDIQSCEKDLLASQRAGSLISHEHLLITSLGAYAASYFPISAEEALADSGKLSARQDLIYLHRLESMTRQASLADILDTTERWLILAEFQRGAATNHPESLPIPIWETWWSRASYANAMIAVNHFQDQLVAAFRIHSLAGRLIALKKVETLWQHQLGNPIGSFFAIQVRNFEPILVNTARDTVSSRMAFLVFALAAYLKNNGIFPDRLAQLTPKYLSVIPRDPFTDEPFQYTAGPDGCTMTSPGRLPSALVAGLRQFQRPITVHLSISPGKSSH